MIMKENLSINEDVVFNQQLLSIERCQPNRRRRHMPSWAVFFWLFFAAGPLILWTYSLVFRAVVE